MDFSDDLNIALLQAKKDAKCLRAELEYQKALIAYIEGQLKQEESSVGFSVEIDTAVE